MLSPRCSTTHRLAGLLLLAFILTPWVQAADNNDSGGTLGLYLENDAFAGTDRYYTSGVKLSWSSPNLERYSDSPYASLFLPLFDLLPYINEAEYQKNLVYGIGQNIYTPDDTESVGDRPADVRRGVDETLAGVRRGQNDFGADSPGLNRLHNRPGCDVAGGSSRIKL
jgi:hypothetical protein